MQHESNKAAAPVAESALPGDTLTALEPPSNRAALSALCVIARLHRVAADPAHVAHQLGWSASHEPSIDDVLLAARHIGLKATRSHSTIERSATWPPSEPGSSKRRRR